MSTAALLSVSIAFVWATVFMPVTSRLAIALGAVAPPNPDVRTHLNATPALGGLAVISAVLVALLMIWLAGVGVGSVSYFCALSLMGALGFYKDVRQSALSPYLQLAIQLTACSILVLSAEGGLEHWSAPAMIALVGAATLITNAFNFIDVMDGLAGTVSAVVALCFVAAGILIGSAQITFVALALAGACGGFLLWNRPPARVFMGDIGSFGIGLTVVYLLITAISAGATVLVLIPLVAVPLLEVFTTVLKRIAAGRSPLHGDASHLSLRLLNSGMSPCTVIAIFAACTAASGLFALAALYYAR